MRNKKVMMFENKRGSKRKIKIKNVFPKLESFFFILVNFSLFLFLWSSKVIPKAQGNAPITF
jgi:hypothetical protein